MCSETTVPSSYFTKFQAHKVNFLGHSPHFNSSQVIKWLPCLSGIFCGVDLPPRSHVLSASFDIRSQAYDRPSERDKPLPVIWGPAPAPCGRIACQTPSLRVPCGSSILSVWSHLGVVGFIASAAWHSCSSIPHRNSRKKKIRTPGICEQSAAFRKNFIKPEGGKQISAVFFLPVYLLTAHQARF